MVQRYCFSNFGQGYFNKYRYLNLLNIPNIYNVYVYKTIQHAYSYRNVYGMFPRSILGLYDYKINVYR